jgi:hypothetical protein
VFLQVVADIECKTSSTSSSGSRNSITITSNSFEELPTSADESVINTTRKGRLTGIKDNFDTEKQSGKINTDAAKMQSLGSQESSSSIPQIQIVSNAHIRVESLSWMDAIRLKHGFDASSIKPVGPSVQTTRLGRTGRAKKDAMELLKDRS